ncbi:MAG: tetratricopeptide repeat protein, partial [Cetobacterium sp.]
MDKNERSNEKYLVLKGANLYSSGKKSEALKMYTDALKLNPQNLIALREKGIILAQLGDLKLGQKNLEKVLK